VAIYEGQLVDYDSDKNALFLRVKKNTQIKLSYKDRFKQTLIPFYIFAPSLYPKMNSYFEYDHGYNPASPIIEIKVDGYSQIAQPVILQALIDSGADGTMLPTQVLEKADASYVDSVRMSGVFGVKEQRDRYRVRIQIGNIIINGIDAVATDSETECLIGRDVLNQFVVTLDGLAAETRISD